MGKFYISSVYDDAPTRIQSPALPLAAMPAPEPEMQEEPAFAAPPQMLKETIREVFVDRPIEVIRTVEVERIVEKRVEIPIEIIKEIIVEKPVERIVHVDKPVPYFVEVPVEVLKEVPAPFIPSWAKWLIFTQSTLLLALVINKLL